MRALVFAAVALLGPAPAPSGPAPSASPPAIAIQWREAPEARAEVDAGLREALREAVAARDGRPPAAIRDHALARARVAVSRELPVELRGLRVELREGLDRADAAYREGRFEVARAELDEALDRLHATPAIPGAAASAREVELLRAKIAWALGETEAAERALAEALRLDPEAQLSVREAAPELVERYHEIQHELLARREAEWIEPEIRLAEGAGSADSRVSPSAPGSAWETDPSVEIDGVPGLRPVPPGLHFFVVHRDGHRPLAAWREADEPWELPAEAPRLPEEVDTTTAAVCEVLGLDLLLLAERRGPRVGLQARRCGVGFGPLWTGTREQLGEGVAVVLGGEFDEGELTLAQAWPVVIAEDVEPEPEPIVQPRPWYRRGWVWGTSAGVVGAVVGGVVAGVLLSGREHGPPAVDVDSGQFIGGGGRGW